MIDPHVNCAKAFRVQGDGGTFSADALASLLDWWVEAGADTLVEDEPRDWLARAAPPLPNAVPAAAATEASPATLDALEAALATSPVPGLSGAARRVAPAGPAEAPLFVLADLPDPDDLAAGRLLDGAAGRLFDRMLAAIGLERAAVRLAPLCPGCPPSSRIGAGALPVLAALARPHLSLARSRALLLLGDAPARALLDLPLAEARGRIHDVNHDGGTVRAIATIHPRMLLRQPLLKAESWKDLRMLAELLR